MRPEEERGFTLMELLAAAMVFGLVGLAMGTYYLFSVQRVEEGASRAEQQRNGSLALQVMADAIRGARKVEIPVAGGPPGSSSSFSAHFPAEPFVDENLNGTWDPTGAVGPCSPAECFQDLNGNSVWDSEVRPAKSFRVSGGQLEVREGEGTWSRFLENRYGETGTSSVWMDELSFIQDTQDPNIIHIRFVLRDDRQTPATPGDDLRQAFELRVRRQS